MEYSKNPIIIIAANPLDVMTYAVFKSSGLDRTKGFGVADILGRARAFLSSDLNVSSKYIQASL